MNGGAELKFVTLDMEIADRMLDSICSITLMEWDNGKLVNVFDTYISPDCEIEEFFADRHGITNEMLDQAPTLREKWVEIYDFMDKKMIFAHFANQTIKMLKRRAITDCLNMPDIRFGCSASIARRTWPGLDDYRLPALTEKLGISKKHYNSYEDARSIARIVEMAAEIYGSRTCGDLFRSIGYAGGILVSQNKISYRAVKDRKTTLFTQIPYRRNNKEPLPQA